MVYTVGETAKKPGTTKIPQNMALSDVPEKFREIRQSVKEKTAMFKQLKYFQSVVRLNSFSEAAEEFAELLKAQFEK